MKNRLKRFFLIKFGRENPEDLIVQSYIQKGMRIGNNCHGLAWCTIDISHCWLIEIGDHVTFAPQAYLLAHDASTKRYLGYTKIAKIKIENHSFVGARAIIMPGVTIGKNTIVAAGSVVTKSVPNGYVVGGNPAKVIAKTEDYIAKHKLNMKTAHVYDDNWTLNKNISREMQFEMSKALDNNVGYVR